MVRINNFSLDYVFIKDLPKGCWYAKLAEGQELLIIKGPYANYAAAYELDGSGDVLEDIRFWNLDLHPYDNSKLYDVRRARIDEITLLNKE